MRSHDEMHKHVMMMMVMMVAVVMVAVRSKITISRQNVRADFALWALGPKELSKEGYGK